MSRFNDDCYDYDEEFNNQNLLFWANCERALRGRPGRKALAELRETLVAMPEKRLISGRLADEKGGVCAVGALVLKRRVEKGELAAAVIEDLSHKIPEDEDYMAADITATAGANAGLTYALAYRLAYLNDEDYWRHTPEDRHAAVIAWIDKQLATPTPATDTSVAPKDGVSP